MTTDLYADSGFTVEELRALATTLENGLHAAGKHAADTASAVAVELYNDLHDEWSAAHRAWMTARALAESVPPAPVGNERRYEIDARHLAAAMRAAAWEEATIDLDRASVKRPGMTGLALELHGGWYTHDAAMRFVEGLARLDREAARWVTVMAEDQGTDGAPVVCLPGIGVKSSPGTCEHQNEVWGPHEGCAEFMAEPEAVVACGEPATRVLALVHLEYDQSARFEVREFCGEHARVTLETWNDPYGSAVLGEVALVA